MKHYSTGEKSRSDWGVIAMVVFLNGLLMIGMMFRNKAMFAVVASLPEFLHYYYIYTNLFILIRDSIMDKSAGTGLDCQS